MVLPGFCYAVSWLRQFKQNQEKQCAEKVIDSTNTLLDFRSLQGVSTVKNIDTIISVAKSRLKQGLRNHYCAIIAKQA